MIFMSEAGLLRGGGQKVHRTQA